MKFFRNAVYVLATLCFLNILQNIYVYKKVVEIQEEKYAIDVKLPLPEELRNMPIHARLRDTQIMQAILMTHHQLGIHKPGSQPMCPMCEDSEIKTITVESN
jgi:hypothetical protein